MKFLKSYLVFHLLILDRIFLKILFIGRNNNSRFSSIRFETLFNIRSTLYRRNVRIRRDSKDGYFRVEDSSGQKRFFQNKIQNFNIYQRGIPERDNNFTQSYLLEEIPWEQTNVVIDCGANIGDLHFALSSLKVNHTYIGFEPSPIEFECLERNVPEGRTYNLGLWEEEGVLDFFISMDNADSSFIKPNVYSEIKQIKTKRLDSMNIDFSTITLLKLEAEGGELEVLKGCTGILGNIKFISADLGFERNGESPLPEVANFLFSHGYEIIKFGFPRIVCLFKNKNF